MEYHWFAGRKYYPSGGMGDYQGKFNAESTSEIEYYILEQYMESENSLGFMDWVHVADANLNHVATVDFYEHRDNPVFIWH